MPICGVNESDIQEMDIDSDGNSRCFIAAESGRSGHFDLVGFGVRRYEEARKKFVEMARDSRCEELRLWLPGEPSYSRMIRDAVRYGNEYHEHGGNRIGIYKLR